jgi:FKBP-type peptidyl-prolyl cis-trans isomerase FklB
MKRLLLAVIILGCLRGEVRAADQPALKDEKQKVSYSLGMNMGSNLKNNDVEVDFDLLVRGIKDVLEGKTTLLTEAEERQVLTAYSTELRAKAQEKRKQLAEKNKKEAETFLAENKTKPGVVTLPSGLQYKVLADGNGESPTTNDTVAVNYRGTLIDGTEFDSSAKTGHPWTNAVTRVIKGWTEALQMMKVGAKWQLFVPPQLAYGEMGRGRQIAPNAALIFEMELVGVQHPVPVAKPASTNEPITSDVIRVPSAEELKQGAKIEVIKKEDVEKLQKQNK